MKLRRHLLNQGISVATAAALLLICGLAARAATVEDYDARLSRAIGFLEPFENNQKGHTANEPWPANLDFVRQQLPAKETIQFRGQPIVVDNSWLETDASEYASASKAAERGAAIARIAERLKAIQSALHELSAAATPAGDKDADKGRLAQILRRPEYQHTEPQTSALQQLIDRFLNWLRKLIPEPKPIQPGSSRWFSAAAQIVVIALCVAAIGFLIWRYGPRLWSDRRQRKKKREARIVLGERLEPDQTAADLLAQAEGLAREGNLRAAIRKAYIAVLCELGDRKIISLAQYKTNRDYLLAVRDKGSLYSSMRQLTNMFELHWYGFVPAGEADWDEFRNGYRKMFRSNE